MITPNCLSLLTPKFENEMNFMKQSPFLQRVQLQQPHQQNELQPNTKIEASSNMHFKHNVKSMSLNANYNYLSHSNDISKLYANPSMIHETIVIPKSETRKFTDFSIETILGLTKNISLSTSSQPSSPANAGVKDVLYFDCFSNHPLSATSTSPSVSSTEASITSNSVISSPDYGYQHIDPLVDADSHHAARITPLNNNVNSRNSTESRQGLDIARNDKKMRRIRPKKYKCSYCWVALSNKGQLRGHMRTHTGERPFHCDDCGKNFTRNEELTRHKRIHTGHKPHECDHCPKRFTRKDHLKKHLKTHAKEFSR